MEYIARQFKKPTGFGGKIVTLIMNYQNRKQYKAVVENIDIQATDTVLDIGFGNGRLMRMLSVANPQKIVGIDISQDMLKAVAKKNRTKINMGEIELLLADVHRLPIADSLIDKAYTVNTVYFWQDVQQVLSEIIRVLKPGGIFLNVLYVKEFLQTLPVARYGYIMYTAEQIKGKTDESGLVVERILEVQPGKSICIISRKTV